MECQPVGVPEIAAHFGVTRKAVDAWRARDIGFPQARWIVGGRPCWNLPDIIEWHIQRWPNSG